MAEKEVRIVIKNEINYHPPYGGWRGDGKEIVLTRAEAIEKMAKAICANIDEYADCEQCEFNEPEDCKRYYRSNWLYTAEAALNAILEE